MNATEQERDHARSQAEAQFGTIQELMEAHRHASEHGQCEYDGETYDEDNLRQLAFENVLSVEVRSGWTPVGQALEAAEFLLLLCTGGPAVRVVGELDAHNEPDKARLEYQDWGTPWTEYWLDSEDEEVLLAYCQLFYFG